MRATFVVDEVFALPCCHADLSGNAVPKKRYPCISWPLTVGPVGCPETSVRN